MAAHVSALRDLLSSADDGAHALVRSRSAAYAWCLWSLLSFLAVICGTGGPECLAAGLVTGLGGVRRLWVLTDRDHRTELQRHHKAEVGWWLDRLHWSESTAERTAAHMLLLAWGEEGLEDFDPTLSPAERLRSLHGRVQAKAAVLPAITR